MNALAASRFNNPYWYQLSSARAIFPCWFPSRLFNGGNGDRFAPNEDSKAQQNASLAPLVQQPLSLSGLSNFIASALHKLVVLVTSIRHLSANEVYTRRVLQEQVGIDPFDLDSLSIHHPEIFHLSVRKAIEPVTTYLRSQGLTGSALSTLITKAPKILSMNVENEVMPLCNFLKNQLGGRGLGTLLRCPEITRIPSAALQNTARKLKEHGSSDAEISMLLWNFPDAYCGIASALGDGSDTDGHHRFTAREEIDSIVHALKKYASHYPYSRSADTRGDGHEHVSLLSPAPLDHRSDKSVAELELMTAVDKIHKRLKHNME